MALKQCMSMIYLIAWCVKRRLIHLERLPKIYRIPTMCWATRQVKTKGTNITNYSHDKANQLTTINGMSLTYDANGNMTSDGSNTYYYNAENQLTSVKNSLGTTIANYEYNHNGQRFKKVTGDKTEYYYYNADHLAYITDELNKVRYSFTRNEAGQLLTMTDHTDSSPVNYFYGLTYMEMLWD
jgi:YD repeat-containing protein